MPKADRTANVQWKGSLREGEGNIVSTGSGAFGNLPVTWAARTEASNGLTSPEELLAAAHAACFSMALSGGLGRAGFTPELLDVTAVCTFEPPKITTMKLTIKARVPGIDEEQFKSVVEATENGGCPVSNAFKGNVEISVDATLEA